MADSDVRCVLVKIHGIGQQRAPDWHQEFDQKLGQALAGFSAGQRERFVNEAVTWADLSSLFTAPTGGTADLAQPSATVDVEYGLVYQSYGNYLASGGNTAMGSPAGLGLPDPRTILTQLRDLTFNAADQAHDVAMYVANNGMRTQIQHRLAAMLYQLHDRYTNAMLILGSHSQGTMVSYDVLRAIGSRLPRLRTWVTMGSPLAYYTNNAKWGREILDVPPGLTWLNYYDDKDAVGKELAPLISWPQPTPQDSDVDNTGQGLHAHDHWHNPTVIANYAALVSQLVGP